MAYDNRPLQTSPERQVTTVREFGDRVHWGAIIAGLVMAISTQLLLSAIGDWCRCRRSQCPYP